MTARLPRLIAITDCSLLPSTEVVARARDLAHLARPASVALLLRDHALSARERLTLGRALGAVARSTGQSLWVADRVDLALLLEADALHLGEGSVAAASARRLWGHERPVSRAWHESAPPPPGELEGVDALLLSPLLAERKGRAALGTSALPELERAIADQGRSVAIYALGGVSAENAAACLAAGATGVAAIGAALASDPRPLLEALSCRR